MESKTDLKDAIITKFKRDNDLDYKPNQIVVSTGAKQSLANIAGVMLNEGDEVILPCPYWVSYSDIVKLYDGIPVEVKTSIDTDFKMTPKQLEGAITPNTKMIWFSSPCAYPEHGRVCVDHCRIARQVVLSSHRPAVRHR